MGANDRFIVMDTPAAAPGECYICKSIRQGPFVDTRINFPWGGVLYICKGCIVMMLPAFGLTLAEPDAVKEEVIEEVVEEPDQPLTVKGLHDALDAYFGTRDSLTGPGDSNFSQSEGVPTNSLREASGGTDKSNEVPEDADGTVKSVPGDARKSAGNRTGSVKSGKQSDKPSGSEGPDGISGSAGGDGINIQPLGI